MTARPAPDLFADRDVFGLPALIGAVPEAIIAGLATLAMSAPLWGNETDWRELVDRLQAFAARWHYPAAAAGWSDVQLFGDIVVDKPTTFSCVSWVREASP
jgi:hypothetical protein